VEGKRKKKWKRWKDRRRSKNGHFTNDELEKRQNVWKRSKTEETREGGVEITSAEMKRGKICEREDEWIYNGRKESVSRL